MAPPSSEMLQRAPSGHVRPPRIASSQRLRTKGSDDRVIVGASAAVLLLFIGSLLIPANVEVAGIKFTPYRILLIPLCIPLFLRLVSDREHPVNVIDILFMGYISWAALAVFYNHGPSRIPWIAGTAIDEFGAYLVGRTLIRNAADYRRFFKYVFWALLFLLPFAMVELLTGRNLLFTIVSLFATPNQSAGQPPRLGLNRVQSVFAHSILFGVFCSIAIANLFYIHRHAFFVRWSGVSLATVMTFMSLSSAPIIAMGLQFALMAWERCTRFLPGRWIVLGAASALVLAVVQLSLPHGLVGLIIENATFDPNTGWGRVEIFTYGGAEILRHPIFGIGFNDWVRPFWKKESVDNFWILLAMRLGLPAALLFLAALTWHCARIALLPGPDEEVARYRTGYLIAWVGIFFALWTVALFSALTPFLMAYLGAGAWFYAGGERRHDYSRPSSKERSPFRRNEGAGVRRGSAGEAGPARRNGLAGFNHATRLREQRSERGDSFRALRDEPHQGRESGGDRVALPSRQDEAASR